jgi:two-component system KDP operon response regulator KdpE
MRDDAPVILVIEDEISIRRFLRASLPLHGYRVIEASTGEEGLRLASAHRPSIVLLDLGLPTMSGLEVVERLRTWHAGPLIVLSARDGEMDKIEALDRGADDYLTKPFGVGELMARIRVALRHSRASAEPSGRVLTCGAWTVNLETRQVHVSGQEIRLTPTEFKILERLARHPGQVVMHRQILLDVWGIEDDSTHHALRVHMSQLRRKLEIDPNRPRHLLTEPRVGYRLRDT